VELAIRTCPDGQAADAAVRPGDVTMATERLPGQGGSHHNPVRAHVVETIRLLVVAGIPYGALVAGLGSRLCMLVLRVTSSDQVIGLRSDDDFVIGKFTIAGTYNLMVLGAGLGVVGVGAYLLVAPRLLGPTWFRHLTVGLASGAVVGAMVIHPGGVDFTRLTPSQVGVSLFVWLPIVFGMFVGPTVTSVASPTSFTRRGRRRWVTPVAAVAFFPPTLPLVIAAAAVVTVAVTIASTAPLDRLRRTQTYVHATRAAWLIVAVAGLAALVDDVRLIL
jgi:hypothetical protein